MSNNQKISDELLVRYLNKDVNDQEAAMITRWLEEKPNEERFNAIKALWAITDVQQPSFLDSEMAWAQMKHKAMQQPRRTMTLPVLLKAAAVLLLCIGAYAWLHFSKNETTPAIAVADKPTPIKKLTEITEPTQPEATPLPVTQQKPQKRETASRNPKASRSKGFSLAMAHSKEEICNSTLCPLEICIVQSLQCEGKESIFAHCSLLQPDQSGAIHYKTLDKQNCNAPVQEIRIKRVTTGETIVLNQQSEVTAQDFFDYITGNKTGDIIAGIFESDCNNACFDQSIKLDNTLGIPELR